MGTFIKGDVVVLPFLYSDFSKSKNRPALVLATPRQDEVIVCQITGEIHDLNMQFLSATTISFRVD